MQTEHRESVFKLGLQASGQSLGDPWTLRENLQISYDNIKTDRTPS